MRNLGSIKIYKNFKDSVRDFVVAIVQDLVVICFREVEDIVVGSIEDLNPLTNILKTKEDSKFEEKYFK